MSAPDTLVDFHTGEDYDCKPNLWSGCYFLWPIAWIFFYLAIRQVNKLIAEGKQSEAKYVWIKRKWYWLCGNQPVRSGVR